MRQLGWAACATTVVVLAGGCGGMGDPTPDSPLSEEEAAERVDEHIRDVTTALPDSLELESRGEANSAACDPEPLITVTKRYWLEGLPAEENEQHVEALAQYWGANGYTVLDDLRPDDLFMSVRHEDDMFRMSVRSSVQGDLSIGASSPCIHPTGGDDEE